jgi:hypothetical protein
VRENRLDQVAIRVLARDLSDGPLQGGDVSISSSFERLRKPDSVQHIGTTDETGLFTLHAASESPPPSSIEISVPGYVAQLVLSPQWGREYVARLVPCVDFHAIAVDAEGVPVPDVLLALSRSRLPQSLLEGSGDLSRNALPGPVADEAIYAAFSDSQGSLIVKGLGPGVYHVALLHPLLTWIPTDNLFKQGLSLPCAPCVFEFHPILGRAVEFTGDVVIASSYRYPSSRNWHTKMTLYRRAFRYSQGEPRKFLALSDGTLTPARLVADVCFRTNGWKHFEWDLLPIEDPIVPTVFHVDTGSNTGDVGTIRVTVTNRGKPLANPMRLRSRSKERIFAIDFTSGDVVELPVGDYSLDGDEAFVNWSARDRRIAVLPGIQNTVEINTDLVLASFSFFIDGKEVRGDTLVEVKSEGFPQVAFSLESGATRWIPPGVLQVRVLAQGCQRFESRYNVPATNDDEAFRIKCALSK